MHDFNYQAPLETTPYTKYTPHNLTANLIHNKARGLWPDILQALGIDATYLQNKHGPCPACGGRDRFRFDDKNRGNFFCNHCGTGDGIELLRLCNKWHFKRTLQEVAQVLGVQSEQSFLSSPKHVSYYLGRALNYNQQPQSSQNSFNSRRKNLSLVWQSARPVIHGDPVDCYLKARGLELNVFPLVLRFHFCFSVGLDDEDILKTIPIKDCCYDLDILLGAEIEVDMQYMNHIKDFFLEHWHF